MLTKPEDCKGCKLYTLGSGFLGDTRPQRPITIIRYLTSKDFIHLDKHFSPSCAFGEESRRFMIKELRLEGEEELDELVGYSTLIRCYLGSIRSMDKKRVVDLEKQANSKLMTEVKSCRAIHDKNRYSIVLFSFDFVDGIETPAYKSIIGRVLHKAKVLWDRHQLPIGIYMGNKCLEYVLPKVHGGVKVFSGHFIFTGE